MTHWDDGEVDDFKFILEGASDLSSCDLAVVCDKSCRDVGSFFFPPQIVDSPCFTPQVHAHRRIYAAQPPDDASSSEQDSHSDSNSADYEKPVFSVYLLPTIHRRRKPYRDIDDIVRGSKASGSLPPYGFMLRKHVALARLISVIIVRKYASIWESATHRPTVGVIARTCIVIVIVNASYHVRFHIFPLLVST